MKAVQIKVKLLAASLFVALFVMFPIVSRAITSGLNLRDSSSGIVLNLATPLGKVLGVSTRVKTQKPGHAPGSNVLSGDGTVYWLSFDNSKDPYPNWGVYKTWGGTIYKATTADLAKPTGSIVAPKNGSLINDHGTIYIISQGQKQGFTSMAAFTGRGYKLKNVVNADIFYVAQGQPLALPRGF
jgi:hypothetical protein